MPHTVTTSIYPTRSTLYTFGEVSEPINETENYDSKQNQALISKANKMPIVKYKITVNKLNNNFDTQA